MLKNQESCKQANTWRWVLRSLLFVLFSIINIAPANAACDFPIFRSISSDINYLLPTGYTTFERAVFLDTQIQSLIYDDPEDNARSDQSVYVYRAEFSDGVAMPMFVHTGFGNLAAGQIQAQLFGEELGRLPYHLRKGVTDYAYIHDKRGFYWGAVGRIIIPGGNRGRGSYDEKIVSELTHASVDITDDPDAFVAARDADDCFISERALGDVSGHDMNHSYAAWLVYRYFDDTAVIREDTLAESVMEISEEIPNRLAYFDLQQYSTHPVDLKYLGSNQLGKAQATGDFNNDGHIDLAIGSPFSDIEGVADAGKVDVFYGSESGLSSVSDQTIFQGGQGVGGSNERGDNFGFSLASADFNNDGNTDLAIGLPGEAVGSIRNAGAVVVIYGSSSGLRLTGNDKWHQGSEGISGTLEEDDRFGYSLAAGSFGRSRHDDLVIGVPFEDVGNRADVGAVHVLYGSPNGLAVNNQQMLVQGDSGIGGTAESGDLFGYALAVGNFGGNGRDDLAIGAPMEDIGNIRNAGAVFVIYGSGRGLHSNNHSIWHQNTPGVGGTAEVGDQFGSALAAGDFGHSGGDDLAIGIPFEDNSAEVRDTGAVQILYARNNRLRANNNQIIGQSTPGIQGTSEEGDRFGTALVAGQFGNGNRDDLAIAAPSEDSSNRINIGQVTVVHGSSSGVSGQGSSVWNRNLPTIPGGSVSFDLLGTSLAAGDFNGDNTDDLVFSIPGDDVGGFSDVGSAVVIFGSSAGLSESGGQQLFGSYHFGGR